MANTYFWQKESHLRQSFSITQDKTEKANLKRKSLFSAEGEGKAGKNHFLFKPDGRFNRVIDIYNAQDEKKLGRLNFRWIDFQKSTLTLENGKQFYFRSHEILKGAWAWYEEDKPNPAMTLHVDNPFHRSGEIELGGTKLAAADRDLLLTLGTLMLLYINTWMIIAIIVAIAVIS